MKTLLFASVAVAALASPAAAKDITITLNDDEQKARWLESSGYEQPQEEPATVSHQAAEASQRGD